MTLAATALVVLALTQSIAVSGFPHGTHGRPWTPVIGTINVRLPPPIDPNVDTSPPAWEPMPPGPITVTGTLSLSAASLIQPLTPSRYVAYSSNEPYQSLRDLIWSLSPVLPTCGLEVNATPDSCPQGTFPEQLNDLSTWFTANDSTKYVSAFAYDTPRRVNNASAGPGWVDVWDTIGAGPLSYFQQGWQPLAWGSDHDGAGYILNYELAVEATNTPPCMDLLSRVAAGPDKATTDAIYEAVKDAGSGELTELLGRVMRLKYDGARDALPAFVCGPECVNNTDLAAAGTI